MTNAPGDMFDLFINPNAYLDTPQESGQVKVPDLLSQESITSSLDPRANGEKYVPLSVDPLTACLDPLFWEPKYLLEYILTSSTRPAPVGFINPEKLSSYPPSALTIPNLPYFHSDSDTSEYSPLSSPSSSSDSSLSYISGDSEEAELAPPPALMPQEVNGAPDLSIYSSPTSPAQESLRFLPTSSPPRSLSPSQLACNAPSPPSFNLPTSTIETSLSGSSSSSKNKGRKDKRTMQRSSRKSTRVRRDRNPLKNQNGRSREKHICELCPTRPSFSRLTDLKRHQETSKSCPARETKKASKFGCEHVGCPSSYARSDALLRHVKAKHIPPTA